MKKILILLALVAAFFIGSLVSRKGETKISSEPADSNVFVAEAVVEATAPTTNNVLEVNFENFELKL